MTKYMLRCSSCKGASKCKRIEVGPRQIYVCIRGGGCLKITQIACLTKYRIPYFLSLSLLLPDKEVAIVLYY